MTAITIQHGKTFRTYRYPSTDQRNPSFDSARFCKSWARYVGSSHQHWKTGELVLCWSEAGPYPAEREALRADLEADCRNVGSVLHFLDERDRADAARAQATWKKAS